MGVSVTDNTACQDSGIKTRQGHVGYIFFVITLHTYFTFLLHNTQFTFTQFSQRKKYFELKCKYFNVILLI